AARRLRSVIRSIECCAGRAVGAVPGVNSRLSIREMRSGKLCPIRARGTGRLKDLRKGRATVARTSDSPAEDAHINCAGRRRIEFNVIHPAKGAEARYECAARK